MPKKSLVEPGGSAAESSERSLDLAIAYVMTLLMKERLAKDQLEMADVAKMAAGAKSAVFTELFKKEVEPKEREFKLLLESAKLRAKKALGKYYDRMDTLKIKSETACTFGGRAKTVSSVAPLKALKHILEYAPVLHESNSIVDQADELLKCVNMVFAAFA